MGREVGRRDKVAEGGRRDGWWERRERAGARKLAGEWGGGGDR